MTNEDTAWEQFSKADGANIGDASAAGMLQAIMAELNSVKADTARLAQKIDGGAGGAPPMDEAAPMGMPPEVPPMDEGGEAPPMEGMEGAPEDMAAGAGDMAGGDLEMPPAPPIPGAAGGNALPNIFANMPVREEDETLLALQDALSQVGDPKAIAKLADIIKDYVEENYEGGAEASAGAEVPPEALIEELAAGDVPAEPPMDEGGEDMAVAAQLLDALTKSDPKGCGDDASTSSIAESGDATDNSASDASSNESVETSAEPLEASDDAEVKEDVGEMKPDIQINLFLNTKVDDILNDNKTKGLTDDKSIDTESFKVCDNPIKKSIDDLMNERMRTKSGIDGKRYKISKSATELQREEFASIQKSIGSFDAVKGMRVGDVLTTMKGLRSRGATSIEKSYAPLIDEMVKYCDNNISPLYTAPIFKSFGVDLDKIYEPLDLEPFMRTRQLPKNVMGDPLEKKDRMDRRRLEEMGITDPALQDRILKQAALDTQYKNLANENDKYESYYTQDADLARIAGLSNNSVLMSAAEMYDKLKDNALFKGENVTPLAPPEDGESPESYLSKIAPYLTLIKYGLPIDDLETATRAYKNLVRMEPMVRVGGFRPRSAVEEDLMNEMLNREEVKGLKDVLQSKTGVSFPGGYQQTTSANVYPERKTLAERDAVRNAMLAKWYLNELVKGGNGLTLGDTVIPPEILRKYVEYDPEDYADEGLPEEIEDIFPGIVSYWKNPAMNINGKYYPMDAESLEQILRPALAGGIKGFNGSDADKKLTRWIEAIKNGESYKTVNPARDDFLTALSSGGDVMEGLKDNIFGTNGKGATGVLFENSPLRPIFDQDRGGVRMNPEFWKQVQGAARGFTGIQDDASPEDLVTRLEGLTSGTAGAFEGYDPRTKEQRSINGADSLITTNTGRRIRTPISAAVTGNRSGKKFLALGNSMFDEVSTPEQIKEVPRQLKDLTEQKKQETPDAAAKEEEPNKKGASKHGQYGKSKK